MEKLSSKRLTREIGGEILGGTLSLTISALIVKLLGLIYKIPLAAILTDEGMGYFNSAYTVYAFFYLLCTAGVPKAITILISGSGREDTKIDEHRIVRVASYSFLIIGATFGLLFIILSRPLSALIGSSRSALSMIAIAPSVIFVSLSGVVRGYLSAKMRLAELAVSQVIEGVGRLALGLAFAMLATSLNMPLEVVSAMTILGVTLSSGVGTLYLLISSKIKIKKENIGQSENKLKSSRIFLRIISISIPITASAAIMSITNLIDLGLIMRSLGEIGYNEAEASALYGNYTTLAVPMLNLAISLISPISVAHLPLFAEAMKSSDKAMIRNAERGALTLSSLMSAPMMLGLCFFATEILSLLFVGSDTKIGGALLCLLAPSIFFASLLLIVNTLLEAMGRVGVPLVSMLAGSLAKIIVSYLLITQSDMGILGAPIGTVVSYAVALIFSLIFYGRTTGRSLPIFGPVVKTHLCALCAVMLSRIAYERLAGLLEWRISLVCCIALAAIIYFTLTFILCITRPKELIKMAKYTKATR